MSSGQWLVAGGRVSKRPIASPLPIPVLVADKNPGVMEAVASVLQRSMPGIALSLCPSHASAMHSLSTARYQVVLCGAQFAAAGDFMLLKQHRAVQQAVPFLLVAQGQDRDLAQCAVMQQGVEDIVVWPLLKGQLEESLRQAMCLYRTRLTMADRRQHLHTLHSCQSLPPRQTRGAIRRIEANLRDLARVVVDCEREAHKRAVDHLDLLGRAEREVSHT
jgi:DNA-binding NtrC family response regulator